MWGDRGLPHFTLKEDFGLPILGMRNTSDRDHVQLQWTEFHKETAKEGELVHHKSAKEDEGIHPAVHNRYDSGAHMHICKSSHLPWLNGTTSVGFQVELILRKPLVTT